MLTADETYLTEIGLADAEQIRAAAASRPDARESLAVALQRLGTVDPSAVAEAIARRHALPLVEDGDWPSAMVPEGVSAHFLNDNAMLPLRVEDGPTLVVAMADPGQADARASLALATGMPLDIRVAPYHRIAAALAKLMRSDAPVEDDAAGDAPDAELLDDLALEAPIIDLVNQLLLEAVLRRATDLHIEARRNHVVLRERVDGMLRESGRLEAKIGRSVISRIKVLARLNIAERRIPQDGQARLRINDRDYDLRVVTVPTVHGESTAIRLLSTAAQIPAIERLGLSPRDEGALRGALAAANGLVVVTGPTGSGKTTTLAACLNMLNVAERKLVTIEDPVEYQIEGVSQIQVKPEIGITFASVLRTLLRYDPDVMMVGEVRDEETARIAIQASLTGHLVLTTLHTNSAAGAVTRLLDMGVQGYLLASSLRGVVAQRLVRKLCPYCRQPVREVLGLPPDALEGSGYAPGDSIEAWGPGGCERCDGTGYLGRLPVFEVLTSDDRLQDAIAHGQGTREIERLARRAGMASLLADGIAKCRNGATDLDEVKRAALNAMEAS